MLMVFNIRRNGYYVYFINNTETITKTILESDEDEADPRSSCKQTTVFFILNDGNLMET